MARQFPDIGKTEFTAKIPTPLYNEFIGFFPMHGANSWFIVNALEQLLEICRTQPSALDNLRDAVSNAVKQA
jgi:hypothetical protein